MKLMGIGGLLGSFAITAGTFGVHGLGGQLTPQAQGWWETATLYLMVHAVAVVALASNDEQHWRWPAQLFAPGAAIFAGTLYAMALGAPRWLGAVTPVGGTLMLCGWGLLFILSLGRRKS